MSKNLGPVNLENSDEEFSFISNKSNETIKNRLRDKRYSQ